MKIIVFSDSHGRYANMQSALDKHNDADVFVHCGDGISDLSCLNIPNVMNIVKVNGNFEDFTGAQNKKREIFEVNGHKIFVCHGHGVLGYGITGDIYERLLRAAIGQGADIIIHGHTHRRAEKYYPVEDLPEKYDKGIYVFNPGSISQPRDGKKCSYGIIEIRENGILFSHGEV